MSETPEPLSARVTGPSSVRADLTTDSSFVDNQAREQRIQFSPEEAKHQRQLQSDTHKQDMERQQLNFDLEQRKKDSDFRRRSFGGIIILLLLALVVTTWVGIFVEDQGTKQWGQGIATTILGGLVGAVAGYFAGRGAD